MRLLIQGAKSAVMSAGKRTPPLSFVTQAAEGKAKANSPHLVGGAARHGRYAAACPSQARGAAGAWDRMNCSTKRRYAQR
ncbi:MAG: hypothetical protein IPG91_23250 [Ideonella sp.]|nr:hypothetical protein [Ideonella sp.]